MEMTKFWQVLHKCSTIILSYMRKYQVVEIEYYAMVLLDIVFELVLIK